MATILIPTIQDDIHAAAVALVLDKAGHCPIRWFCGDLPQTCTASYSVATRTPETMSLHDSRSELPLDDVDVFWNRRIGAPIVKQALVPSDKQVATEQSTHFVRGLLMAISDSTFSINDYRSAIAAENKILQLHVARDVAFSLPETLTSNDPRSIRRFLREHEDTGTIFKSFKPVTWEGQDRIAILYTSMVQVDALPTDSLLQLSPSIFQAYVPKAFEVRVTCMGAELVAAQLHSQSTRHGVVDWRLASHEEMQISRINLPDDVARKCRALMKRLGLVFGCFDFIVTPAGEYVFLEINQMGQFLWIEDANPEFPLLEMFCDFIASGAPNFRYTPSRRQLSYWDVRDSAVALIEEDHQVHLKSEHFAHIVHE